MMNSNYYRSELKLRGIKRYKLIGITSEILLSKEYFPKNEDIQSFLIDNLNVRFKEYVFKSRTMIVARMTRIIYSLEEDEIEVMRKNIFKFLERNTEHLEKKDAQSTNLSRWIKGISNE